MKEPITTTSMTTILHRTDERLVAEQLALCNALKAVVHATKETDNHGHQLVALRLPKCATQYVIRRMTPGSPRISPTYCQRCAAHALSRCRCDDRLCCAPAASRRRGPSRKAASTSSVHP
jgi:hypothetical protein